MLRKFKIILGIEAEDDVDNIIGHYDELRQGLGEEFNEILIKQLELLRTQPEMFTKYNKFARKGNMEKFPYSFYYQEDMPQEVIDILGIFAQTRNPKAIQEELERRRKK